MNDNDMKKAVEDFITEHPLPYDFSVCSPTNVLGAAIGAPIACLHDGRRQRLCFDTDRAAAEVAVYALNKKIPCGATLENGNSSTPRSQRHLVAPFKVVENVAMESWQTSDKWKIEDADGRQAFFGWYRWQCAEAIMGIANI